MKQFNQIILCSRAKGRSYLREIAVFDQFGIVTNIEPLPFRYHEMLAKQKAKDEFIITLDTPIKQTARNNGCPFCGQVTLFQCSRCGFLSCADIRKLEHCCPGCDRNSPIYVATRTHVSESGFVAKALIKPKERNYWADAQATLLGLINHQP